MCTAMLYDPKDHYEPEETKQFFKEKSKVLERLMRIKQWKFLRSFLKKEKNGAGKLKSFLHYFFNF